MVDRVSMGSVAQRPQPVTWVASGVLRANTFRMGSWSPGTAGVPLPCLCAHVYESMGSRIFPHVHTHEHTDVLTYMHMCVHVHT